MMRLKSKILLLAMSILMGMWMVTGCSMFVNQDVLEEAKLRRELDNSATEANIQGVKLADEGNIEEALACFEEALEYSIQYRDLVKDEDNKRARGLLGDSYNNLCYVHNLMEMYEIGLEYGDKAVLMEPDSSDSFLNRGNSYYQLGRLEEAMADYKSSIQYNNDSVYGHYGLGSVYYKEGKYAEAIDSFERSLELDPYDTDTYDYLAWCYYYLQDFDQAIMYTDQGLEVEENFDLYYTKGYNIQARDGYDTAEAYYNEIAQIHNNTAEADIFVGNFYYDNYEYEKALQYFLKAENPNLDNVDLNCWIISTYTAMLDMDQADDYYGRVNESGHGTVYFSNYIGQEFTYQGYFLDSIKYFEDAIAMDSDDKDAYVNKLSALYDGERYYRCIEFGEAALEKFDNYYDIIYYIAESNYMLYDFKETIRWYERALEVEPESDLILSYMADVYAIMEDYDNAINYADQALAINHDNTTASAVKNTIKNKQRPVVEQVKEFIEESYLYYDDKMNIDELFPRNYMTNAEIERSLNEMKREGDEFTFLIYGDDYIDDYSLDTSSVEYHDLGDMKYIRVYSFSVNTDHQVVQILDSIEDPENQTLIIDLRMNGGGLTDAANNILDALLPSCVTCTLIDKDGYTSNYYSDEYHIAFKEIYILVDEYSASASELLTLGLKTFLNNVTIIGDTTYGKGVGQWVSEYKNSNLLIYLVNHYWNVREQNIMDKGIEPDIFLKGQELEDYLNLITAMKK